MARANAVGAGAGVPDADGTAVPVQVESVHDVADAAVGVAVGDVPLLNGVADTLAAVEEVPLFGAAELVPLNAVIGAVPFNGFGAWMAESINPTQLV